MAEFVVHQLSLGETEKTYLDSTNQTIKEGFAPNTPAYAAAVNAILHETSLVVTALAQNMSATNPDATLATIKTSLTTYLVGIKPTNATQADKVAHKLKYKINNGALAEYDGSAEKDIGTIYTVTTTAANAMQIMVSDANGLPNWTASQKGSSSEPIYIDTNGIIQKCSTYAGGTSITLNNSSKQAGTASFFAPETTGSNGQLLVWSTTSGKPIWLTNTYGDANTPIWMSNGVVQTANKYAGGTKVTLNGTSKASDDVSFYAPTGQPTRNYVITCDANSNVIWASSPYTLTDTYTASYQSTAYGTAYIFRSHNSVIRTTQSNLVLTTDDSASSTYPVIYDCLQGAKYDTTNGEMIGYNVIADRIYSDDRSSSTSYRTIKYEWRALPLYYNGSAYLNNDVLMMSLALKNRSRTSTGKPTLWVGSGGIETTGEITASKYNAPSDIRLKEHVEDYSAKGSILDLQVKQFDMKADHSHHIGCIAQDLQSIAPELVHENADGYLSIEETKLVYLLLDEVKKLRKELDELKSK